VAHVTDRVTIRDLEFWIEGIGAGGVSVDAVAVRGDGRPRLFHECDPVVPPITSIANVTTGGGGLRVTGDPEIVPTGTFTFTRAQLPGNIRNSTNVQTIEDYINGQIQTALTYTDAGVVRWRFYGAVHVFSNLNNVLSMTGIAADFNGAIGAETTAFKANLGAWWGG
jgi:hypothetical protein